MDKKNVKDLKVNKFECCDCGVEMNTPFKSFDEDHFCKDCCMPCDCKACGCDGACSNECDCYCCSVEGYDDDDEDSEE